LIRFAQLSILNTDWPHKDRRKPTAWSGGSTAALRERSKASMFDQAKGGRRRCRCAWLYNHPLAQLAFGSKTPLHAMKKWHERKPELLTKQLY
jgi:hypothetical protein